MNTQEQVYSKPNALNAATRNIDLMADELAILGHVSPEVRAMVLDEELTHAVEVLAAQELAYAVVPRVYYQVGNDLIDIHNQSLRAVFKGGIEHSRSEVENGVPGADWELERREGEFENLETITLMPNNTACIELSVPPIDKPKEEQLAQHYNGLTMIRVSVKNQNKVMQYNYALPLSNPEFILAIQRNFGRETPVEQIDSLSILKEPILRPVDEAPENTAREFDNLIGAALLETSVGHSAVRMIKRAITSRREAWDFVSSDEHSDIHQELLASMEYAASLNPEDREHAMDAIRSGFWKEYKDRFRGHRQSNQMGDVLSQAASRAVVDGDVFIACGNTVTATAFTTQEASASRSQTASERAKTANQLKNHVEGPGTCSACGAKGLLYGCGVFCGRCNAKWCAEYKRTGRRLSAKQLSYLNYSRGNQEDTASGSGETLSEYWERIGQEIKQKQELNKLRELEKTELAKRSDLALAA